MARSLRFEYAGAFYHVMARGNARGKIFLQDSDRTLFLRTLGEACSRTGWRVHAWVLLSNHYHLLIETPEANLVVGMQWLQNTYTRRFNTRHRAWGRLFGDRYKAVPVEGDGSYYETLLDYLHLNPARAGLVKAAAGASLLDYPWSSIAGGYALPPSKRPPWLHVADGFSVFQCTDTAAGRRAWVARLDRRAREEPRGALGLPGKDPAIDQRRSDLHRGWYWGSQAFAERLLALAAKIPGRQSPRHQRSSAAQHAHSFQEAERILAAGLARRGLSSADLAASPGSEPRKVSLAREIWENTTVSLAWIATHLAMRSPANASQQIRRHRQRENAAEQA